MTRESGSAGLDGLADGFGFGVADGPLRGRAKACERVRLRASDHEAVQFGRTGKRLNFMSQTLAASASDLGRGPLLTFRRPNRLRRPWKSQRPQEPEHPTFDKRLISSIGGRAEEPPAVAKSGHTGPMAKTHSFVVTGPHWTGSLPGNCFGYVPSKKSCGVVKRPHS
jgi:hypothetical protein